MTIEVLDFLIDKEDNFEVVRDQIALILATESANQMVKAVAAAEDPLLWKLDVYTERSNPWAKWANNQADRAPVINVWFDTGTFPESRGNRVSRQLLSGVYNIDCYAVGVAADVSGGGHTPGDQLAAEDAQRAFRLARNILMSNINTYLGLRRTVETRWPQSVSSFQPQQGEEAGLQTHAVRLALQVDLHEYSPQQTPGELEQLHIDIKRNADGKILAGAEYDLT